MAERARHRKRFAYHQAMPANRKRPRSRSTTPPKSVPDRPFADASRPGVVRLQKVLAEAGIASRRECEELIEAGEVSVNGHIVTELPAWVDPANDRIAVHGRRIKPPPTVAQHVYVMLFKPRGVVSTNKDTEGRRRAIDLVKHRSKARLYPVGRLDMDTSGLLLLTNDGELANRLTHPRYEVHRVYEALLSGYVTDVDRAKLERGVFLADRETGRTRRTAPSKLSIIKRDRERTLLRMELREGRNRQIRRMFALLGHGVKKLRRVQMGPLKLRGLQPGQWRDLTPPEIAALRKASQRR
jgi:23S rRNA pseudouridine2605 synthase